MLDTEPTSGPEDPNTPANEPTPRPRRRRAASRPAGPPQPAAELTGPAEPSAAPEPAAEPPAAPARRRTRKAAAAPTAAGAATPPDTVGASADTATAPADAATAAVAADGEPGEAGDAPPARKRAARKAPAKRAARTREPVTEPPVSADAAEPIGTAAEPGPSTAAAATEANAPVAVIFQPPQQLAPEPPARPARKRAAPEEAAGTPEPAGAEPAAEEEPEEGGRRRRRGGRGRRGRGRSAETATPGEEQAAEQPAGESPAGEAEEAGLAGEATESGPAGAEHPDEGETTTTRRRRRRRRRAEGEDDEPRPDDPPNTVVRVRERRTAREDEVRSVKGSVRLEAKKQRRRDGRELGRRRTTVITEAEFLARRESVNREMLVRQVGERTQIAVLEDDVLVEHHVATASATGLVGNVYLGKVQNVLPSMEAAFVDIGRGRNAVLYAGEVNWDAAGLEGQPKRIELALKSGDSVLVQVTKDPIGHKGARLTSQVSMPGRFLVFVPGGSMTGISRKLPDTERNRLKAILKQVLPEDAGVIVRTAAEGASEEELARDVARLQAQWEDIQKKAKTASAPALLYAEPDLAIRVVRDIFNEDFAKLVVSGDDAWDTLDAYVGHVAPDLADRLSRWTDEQDLFTARRVDEQLLKALDRKVWLPSGGYLVIDRTEAMVVVDVNTGKFTGAGGDLEETVTRNNLEAAEEIVRQLRLRDLGGIIVIDFIDMVIESNRELVLRRLLECLGRDRTKHQVAEVTSLGLVQMTRKRIGQGLLEVFSETCDCCNGRGVHVRLEPVEPKPGAERGRGGDRGRRARSGRGGDGADGGTDGNGGTDSGGTGEGRDGESGKRKSGNGQRGKGERAKGERGKGERGKGEGGDAKAPVEPAPLPAV